MKLHSHHSTTARANERGTELGAQHAGELTRIATEYRTFFRAAGLSDAEIRRCAETTLDALDDWRPLLAEELRATAAAAGMEPWLLASVNARTEVMASGARASHECSTLASVPEQGPAWGMQTWDWHPGLVPDGLVWSFDAASGLSITTFTEFGAQAKIGVNNAGLGVMFNFLAHDADTGIAGVPVHSIARAILEETATIEEARDLLSTAPLTASTAFTVIESGTASRDRTDPSSAAVSFEASPAGVGEILPDSAGVLLRTNHFLDPELARGERIPFAESRTRERRELLRAASAATIAGSADPGSRSAALYDGGRGADLCFVPDPTIPATERWETLLTAVVSPADGALELSLQGPGPLGTMTFDRY